jgi:hypothetical protein
MGFEPMTSVLEWSERVCVLDIVTKLLSGFRTVNKLVGFRRVIFISAAATLSACRHRLGCTALQARQLSYITARGPK